MDLEGVVLIEISQTEKNALRSHLRVESKTQANEPNRKSHRCREQSDVCQRPGGGCVGHLKGSGSAGRRLRSGPGAGKCSTGDPASGTRRPGRPAGTGLTADGSASYINV